MNLLRRAQGCFRSDCDAAIATLRRAEVIACDETGVRIEGANAYHWLFHSAAAVVHTASPTRGAVVVREMMDEHRPAVWTRTATPPNKATRMVVFPFARDAFFPVCSPGLLEGPHALRTPDDLRHHPLIHDTSMASTAAFRTWRDWHLAAGLDTSESERGLRINDSAAAYRMAMAGHGVALGRTTLVEQDLKDRRLVRPFGPVLDCGLAYHVVCRPQDVQDQTINAFRDWLIGEVMSEAKV